MLFFLQLPVSNAHIRDMKNHMLFFLQVSNAHSCVMKNQMLFLFTSV